MAERPRPDKAAIRELAQDMLAGRVVSMLDVPKNLLPMVFIPLALGNLRDHFTEDELKVGVLFSVMGRDGDTGRAINGFPMFMGFRVWPRDDYNAAVDLALKAQRALDEDC